MVSIFFVLSSYILSIKPLQHICSGNSSTPLTSLSSSLFRRPIRLFLPTIPVILAVFLGLYFGWNGNGIANTPCYSAGYDFFHLMIGVWWWLLDFIYPFTLLVQRFVYLPHLWTIPLEIRGSLLVFILLLGTGQAKSAVRLPLLCGFGYYCLYHAKRDLFLFVSGIILAELSLIRRDCSHCVLYFLRLSHLSTAL
jgi:hypothetical protein